MHKQTQENMFLLETFIMRLNCRKYGDKAYSYFLKDPNPSIVKAKWNSVETQNTSVWTIAA